TFAGIETSTRVWMNGSFLGEQQHSREQLEFEVTSILGERNEVLVDTKSSPAQARLFGEVTLEVRRTAFLRGVHAYWSEDKTGSRAHIIGQVVGTSDQPLELYVIFRRR